MQTKTNNFQPDPTKQKDMVDSLILTITVQEYNALNISTGNKSIGCVKDEYEIHCK